MSSLKDWMDKRNERRQSAKANSRGKQPSGDNALDNTSTPAEDSDSTPLDDFSNISPPPPAPRNRAREQRFIPPAPRHRYMSTQTPPSLSTSASPKTRTPSPKGSAFSEHFDSQSPKTVTRIHGVDFKMSTAPDGADGPPSNRDDIRTRRSSRSQTRRQERADSHQMIEEDGDKADLDLTLDIPGSLQIHKTQVGRADPPSPLEKDPCSGLDGALRQLSNLPQPGSAEPATKKIGTAVTTSPLPSKSGPSPFMQRLRGSLSRPNTTSSAPPTGIPPPDDEPDLQKFINPDNPTVAVRPPIYDLSKNAAQQWESDLGSTSRPARPWDWTKRWTCCQCEGQTVVEQIVCSNLDCVHDRCPENCRVVRWARPGGIMP